MSKISLVDSVIFRLLGDECITYLGNSGDTHLLDSISAAIINEVKENPLSKDVLFNILSENFESDDDIEISLCLDSYILELSSLGILNMEN